ncbi:hypothetical protein AAFF_G00277390 [Aldrovandia affinis]|uniref:Uncharacterized protein n=1 Tax=Aldrovandia affinis TaxID=143900 RepID=A0AAD7RCV4_9TELE|nr:hypothetical protein AAFF_G00277390 [Aldrovandia affinis]
MREEVEQRDTHILNLREQLLCMTAAEQPPHSQTTDTGSQTETSSQAEPHISLDSSVDPSPPPSTGQHCSSSRTHRPSPPCAQPVAEEQRLQQCRKPPKTAILMDSNGKFLNHREVFPRHSVGKFWCPHTDKALQLLCHTHLGDPDNIIIHTGTNDLRYKERRLPCDLINKINRKITTDCAMLTNVNIAHHPTLTHEHLHDHVHLVRDSVWIFAEDLRGATASGEPSAPHLIRGPPQPHEARRHTPTSEERGEPSLPEPHPVGLQPSRSPPSGAPPSRAQPDTGARSQDNMASNAHYTGAQHGTAQAMLSPERHPTYAQVVSGNPDIES